MDTLGTPVVQFLPSSFPCFISIFFDSNFKVGSSDQQYCISEELFKMHIYEFHSNLLNYNLWRKGQEIVLMWLLEGSYDISL